jgi:glyoxylase-like metal-dependent hydrolase (beta-lactamase superfamily II)
VHLFHGIGLFRKPSKKCQITKNESPQQITILKTPGHTYGSISVVYGDYVIVGDAAPLRENILGDILPSVIVDYRAAKGSLRRIKLLKKNIITGHDGIVYKEEFL